MRKFKKLKKAKIHSNLPIIKNLQVDFNSVNRFIESEEIETKLELKLGSAHASILGKGKHSCKMFKAELGKIFVGNKSRKNHRKFRAIAINQKSETGESTVYYKDHF